MAACVVSPAVVPEQGIQLAAQVEDIEHNKEKIETDPHPVAENLVTFIQPFDSQNPKQWSIRKKWLVTSVMSATSFIRIASSTIMAPAIGVISKDLGMSSTEGSMTLSVYVLASAFGPLVLAPTSELYGRKPVLHASNTWFLIWNVLCGFSHTKGLLMTSRALAGFGGSVAHALGSAVLSDIWAPEERGRGFGIYFLVPLLGAGIGPAVGGYITQYASWQWVFWSLSAVHAGLLVFSFFAFSESHGATILRHRARNFRKTTGNQNLFTLAERLEEGQTVTEVVLRSLTRPLRLLAFHPIIQVVAVIEGFAYGLLYLVLTSFAELWTKYYHESIAISGLHYFAYAKGEIGGAEVGAPLMDHIFRKLKTRKNGEVSPEFRIPLMIFGIILTPIGFLMYGWTAQVRAPWAVVDIGVIVQAFGLQILDMPLSAYVLDAYPDHASSAMAAAQMFRSICAVVFSLFAPRMFATLGYGWGNTTLAVATVALCGPGALLLWTFGSRLRMKAQSSH